MATKNLSFKGHGAGSQLVFPSRKTHICQFHGQMTKVHWGSRSKGMKTWTVGTMA
jgi:hypothetical protein